MIVCVRCGHEESEGAWLLPGDRGDVENYRPPNRRLSTPLTSPSTRSPAPTREITGHGWDPDGVYSVTISHRRAQIKTQALRHAFFEAREASALTLSSVLINADRPCWWWRRRSPAAMALRLTARDRAVAARVARAQQFTVDIPIDGEPTRFEGLRCQVAWAAVGHTEEVQITIGAHRTAPEAVTLRRL